MAKIYAKLIRTKRGYETDMVDLLKKFITANDAYAEWVNYPQKNAYVCQISVINAAKRYNKRCVKACKVKERIYLVRKDKIGMFRIEMGL